MASPTFEKAAGRKAGDWLGIPGLRPDMPIACAKLGVDTLSAGVLDLVHGRAADSFVTAEGRRVTTWQIDQCLADLPGIAHYQLCERAGGEWLLRFVPDVTAPSAGAIEELRQRLTRLLGINGELVVKQTDLLVPESSGKFRLGYPLSKD